MQSINSNLNLVGLVGVSDGGGSDLNITQNALSNPNSPSGLGLSGGTNTSSAVMPF